MIIGAQLYTVRDFTQNEKDFDDTLRKIAAIGYTCVQVSGIGDIEAQKVRDIADKNGIKIILTHTKQDRVLNDTENVIKEHKIMGADFIGIGSMPQKYRGSYEATQQFISDYQKPAQMIKDSGLKFMYHNHHFEFEKFNDKTIFDHLMDGFSPDLMGFILDTYWVQAGGADPAAFLRKLTGRLETIHFKDMQILPDKDTPAGVKQAMSPVLCGNLNWESIFEACKACNAKYAFVEQDDCNGIDPFVCLETSYNNLKKYGYK